jgi:DNA-binding NtrC family response regulator
MKAPVLVVGPRASARAVAAALQPEFAVSLEEDSARARALTAIGAHLVIVAVGGVRIEGSVEVDSSAEPAAIVAAVAGAIAQGSRVLHESAGADDVGVLAYEDYLELVRYAMTRRYLASLLEKHHGSVTDAARGAGLKRESLHRLLRRHHMMAEEFRDR